MAHASKDRPPGVGHRSALRNNVKSASVSATVAPNGSCSELAACPTSVIFGLRFAASVSHSCAFSVVAKRWYVEAWDTLVP